MRWFYLKWMLIKSLACNFFGKNYIAKSCGHKTKKCTRVTIFGKKIFLSFTDKCPSYCAECVAKQAIRCAWCGGTIMPGEPITLYTPSKKDFNVPEYAVIYRKDPLQLVGCLGWDCADSGIDRAGFWVSPGRVQRVVSPMEMVLGGNGEDVVICNDLSDINQAIHIEEKNNEAS